MSPAARYRHQSEACVRPPLCVGERGQALMPCPKCANGNRRTRRRTSEVVSREGSLRAAGHGRGRCVRGMRREVAVGALTADVGSVCGVHGRHAIERSFLPLHDQGVSTSHPEAPETLLRTGRRAPQPGRQTEFLDTRTLPTAAHHHHQHLADVARRNLGKCEARPGKKPITRDEAFQHDTGPPGGDRAARERAAAPRAGQDDTRGRRQLGHHQAVDERVGRVGRLAKAV